MVGSLGELCTVTAEPGVKAERVSWTIAIRVSSKQLVPWSLLYILFSGIDSIRMCAAAVNRQDYYAFQFVLSRSCEIENRADLEEHCN